MITLGFGSALSVETDDRASPRWTNLRECGIFCHQKWAFGIVTVNRLYLSKYLVVPCDLNAPLLLKFTLLIVKFLEREKRETYIWMHIDLQIALIYTFYLLLAIAFDRFETYLIRYDVCS